MPLSENFVRIWINNSIIKLLNKTQLIVSQLHFSILGRINQNKTQMCTQVLSLCFHTVKWSIVTCDLSISLFFHRALHEECTKLTQQLKEKNICSRTKTTWGGTQGQLASVQSHPAAVKHYTVQWKALTLALTAEDIRWEYSRLRWQQGMINSIILQGDLRL